MAGDSTAAADPGVLLEETRRVLEAQQRLVHRQRSRATSSIRVVLTACGLALTLASLGLTAPAGVPLGLSSAVVPGMPVGVGRSTALAVLVALVLLTARMLCAALVVLEPRTAAHPLARLLTTPVFSDPRPSATHSSLPPGRPPTLRTGLDADATTAASTTDDPTLAVLRYNAGCVAGNTTLVEHNRWYLTRVYRSATATVGLTTLALVVVIAGQL